MIKYKKQSGITSRMTGIKIGLIGCGSIGTVLARHMDRDKELCLSFIFDKDSKKASDLLKKLKSRPRNAGGVGEMTGCDLIIEAASQEAVREYSMEILDNSDMMVMSVGAFGDSALFNKVKKKAGDKGRKVYIPSGAISGLDGIKSAGAGKIDKVVLTTRKPPNGLEGAPWLVKNEIGVHSFRKPTVVFEGSAREAARWFPNNVNVSVALALAGIGAERTQVRIIADPFIDKNIHEMEVEGTFGRMTMKTENVPSLGNSKTSYLAALSAIATLKKIKESVIIGT
jgi:aspartate dehydrogenase